MRRFTLLLALLVPACGGGGGGGGGSAPPTALANETSPLGTNLTGINYWTAELPFKDVFKAAAPWIPQTDPPSTWNTGQAFAGATADGYPLLNPGQAAGTLLLWGLGTHYPAGRYVCLYDGQGTIRFRSGATVASEVPGRIEIDVVPNNGIWLQLTATNPVDPVRNIRVIVPGAEATYLSAPFRPEFLDRWRSFKVLRFMDWGRTNQTTVANWADRSTPTYYSQGTTRGVAPEHMIALANELHADPWFCMPHLATDDYVRQFATLVRDTLDPSLRVTLEHSNEVWNGIFPQAAYAQSQGLAAGLSANAYEAQLRWHSQRSVQMFRIWDQVFGGASRLVRVLASQSANPWTGTTVMDWQNAAAESDALAIAPYFGGYLGAESTQATIATWTVQQVLDACETDIAAQMGRVATNRANAESRGIVLIAYEAGQHLVGVNSAQNNQALTDLFIASNRDPRMGDLYRTYLDGWRANGGRMCVNFSSVSAPNRYGSWGLLEYDDRTAAPKYRAVLDFIRNNPRWW